MYTDLHIYLHTHIHRYKYKHRYIINMYIGIYVVFDRYMFIDIYINQVIILIGRILRRN